MSKEQEIRRLLQEVVCNFGEAAKEFKHLADIDTVSEADFLDAMADAHGLIERRKWRLRRVHQLLYAKQLEAECDSGK